MSATYHLKFKRWILRGQSDLMSVTAMRAMTTQAYNRMAAADWAEATGETSDLPIHDFEQTGFKDGYDAAKFCGDYVAGKQAAYACAACYSIRIPAEALAGAKAKVEAIMATCYGDRWLAEGAIVSAFLSASPIPPAWATIVETASPTYLASSPYPAPAIDAVTVPDWQAPLRAYERSNTTDDNAYAATITPAAATDAMAYLHVVVRLSDYINIQLVPVYVKDATTGKWVAVPGEFKDSAWIEGGAKIDGATISVQFDRAVDLGAQAKIQFINEFGYTATGRNYLGFVPAIDNCCSIALKYNQTAGLAPEHELGDAAMMRRLLEQREMQSIGQLNVILDAKPADNVVWGDFSGVGGLVGVTYNSLTGTPAFHRYRLHGVIIGRQTVTNQEIVDGVSLDVDIPALPVGMTVRISVYAHEGPIPAAMYSVEFGERLCNNVFTMETATNAAFILGTATAAKLGTGSSLQMDSLLTFPATEISLIPLGTYDVDATLIESGTKIPFAAPYKLPRYCCIIVSFAVIGFTSEWVPAPGVNSVIDFKPSDIHLHVV
jgi:hypothetical protein